MTGRGETHTEFLPRIGVWFCTTAAAAARDTDRKKGNDKGRPCNCRGSLIWGWVLGAQTWIMDSWSEQRWRCLWCGPWKASWRNSLELAPSKFERKSCSVFLSSLNINLSPTSSFHKYRPKIKVKKKNPHFNIKKKF